jgi:ABC-type amino acid transport substrate-binding protein
VGVIPGRLTLTLSGDQLGGPEADILKSAAEKLKLTIKAVPVNDPVAALNDGTVDIVAGTLAETHDQSKQFWYTLPIGFNPDYIYVAPGKDGSYPKYTKWEDVIAAGAKIAVTSGNPRIADIGEANVQQFPDAAAALQAVADGRAGAFVGSSIEFAKAVASKPDLVKASFSWVRNVNLKVHGEAYAWGVRWGNAQLEDALDSAVTAAWQGGEITRAYREAFRGANITVLTAPGPTAIGTSFGTSKDYQMVGMFYAGPWAQRPGWKQ